MAISQAGDRLGIEILTKLGIPTDRVAAVRLTCVAGSVPILTVTRHVIQGDTDGLVEVFEHYDVVARDG